MLGAGLCPQVLQQKLEDLNVIGGHRYWVGGHRYWVGGHR